MAFKGWRPSTFELDDYVLAPPSTRRAVNGEDGWTGLGLDPRISHRLIQQGCEAPTEIQQKVVAASLAFHHIEASAPSRSGLTTAILATILHSLPPSSPSSSSVSVVYLATSSVRANSFYNRLTDLATPFDVESYCSTDADSLSRDLDSFRSTTPELLTSTIGRLVTLLDHDATDLSSLVSLVLDLTGDSPQDLETVSSHHTLSDVRSILLRTPVSCRIELICGAGREADGVRRLVGKWQDRSIRANLLLLSSKDAWGEEKRRDQGWEQVVDEFEQKGLSPSDFWAVKSAHQEVIRRWVARVDVALELGSSV